MRLGLHDGGRRPCLSYVYVIVRTVSRLTLSTQAARVSGNPRARLRSGVGALSALHQCGVAVGFLAVTLLFVLSIFDIFRAAPLSHLTVTRHFVYSCTTSRAARPRQTSEHRGSLVTLSTHSCVGTVKIRHTTGTVVT